MPTTAPLASSQSSFWWPIQWGGLWSVYSLSWSLDFSVIRLRGGQHSIQAQSCSGLLELLKNGQNMVNLCQITAANQHDSIGNLRTPKLVIRHFASPRSPWIMTPIRYDAIFVVPNNREKTGKIISNLCVQSISFAEKKAESTFGAMTTLTFGQTKHL